jgi:orotate phosphoribosyltransferase
VDIIQAASAQPVAVSISLDRQERGQGARSAIDEIRDDLGLEVLSIATLAGLIDYARSTDALGDQAARLEAYREMYGTA